jgi:predicted transcriptional regulator YheO
MGSKLANGRFLNSKTYRPAQFGDISKVKNHIVSTSKAWDFDKINSTIDSITSSRILKTPLIASVRDDTIVWKLEHDGAYSVRGAYKYCMNIAGTHNNLGITGSWQLIWRMRI